MAPADWEQFSVGGESFRLRRVAAGTHTVGSRDDDEDAFDREKPQHSVRFTRSYGVGEYAVTQGLYEAVMGTNPSDFSGKSDSARRPVEQVSWFHAVAFCNRLSERCGLQPAYRIGPGDPEADEDEDLPQVSCNFSAPGFRLATEHEWEVAARAGTDFAYAGGNDLDSVGWFEDNSGFETHPVGQKSPNAWGLCDMSGNVWEWCWDGFDSSAYQSGTMADPVGPQSGDLRVLRGGGWHGDASGARVAIRDHYVPSYRDDTISFRLTRTLP
jgi:sulfatase modifying factor 1